MGWTAGTGRAGSSGLDLRKSASALPGAVLIAARSTHDQRSEPQCGRRNRKWTGQNARFQTTLLHKHTENAHLPLTYWLLLNRPNRANRDAQAAKAKAAKDQAQLHAVKREIERERQQQQQQPASPLPQQQLSAEQEVRSVCSRISPLSVSILASSF